MKVSKDILKYNILIKRTNFMLHDLIEKRKFIYDCLYYYTYLSWFLNNMNFNETNIELIHKSHKYSDMLFLYYKTNNIAFNSVGHILLLKNYYDFDIYTNIIVYQKFLIFIENKKKLINQINNLNNNIIK